MPKDQLSTHIGTSGDLPCPGHAGLASRSQLLEFPRVETRPSVPLFLQHDTTKHNLSTHFIS